MPSEYVYPDSTCRDSTHTYLWPPIIDELRRADITRVFDLGCGNGSFLRELRARGLAGRGVDLSESGVAMARSQGLDAHVGSAYDDLAALHGRFPAVVSLEVVEHLYAPRRFARTLFDLVECDGIAIVTTPYHGYAKNLALALTGRLDRHLGALWDHGHIKFFSVRSLTTLLTEAGFIEVRVHRVGRILPFAKSMIAVARRPAEPTT